jgi:hypothetical protein
MTKFVFGQHRVKIVSSHIKDLRMVECIYPFSDITIYHVERVMDQSYLTAVPKGFVSEFKN